MNPFLKQVQSAARTGKPGPGGLLVTEGPHLLAEALRSSWTVEHIIATGSALERHAPLVAQACGQHPDCRVEAVSSKLFAQLSQTEHAQQVMALVRPRDWQWHQLLQPAPALILVCDALQDPGNIGTLARSAEAFGATGLVLLAGSVRVSNGKLLRAAAGSLFRLPYLENVTIRDFLAHAHTTAVPMYALHQRGSVIPDSLPLQESAIAIVGNEGAGISQELLAAAQPVAIPTSGVESLNAAVAASIFLHEAFRRRRRP